LDPDDDDHVLLELAKAGGPKGRQAYDALVRRHQHATVRLVMHLLHGRQAEAEDLAQDAFVRAFVGLDRIPKGASFRAWVRVTATRLAYNAQRNRATRSRLRETMPPPAGSTDSSVEDREAVNVAMGRLSYPYREILVLRHVEELSLEEIGALLQIGVSATKMRLKRAREAFLERYEEVTKMRDSEPPTEGNDE
jgi:RNA polymerase sigma-70 factor (ECF subfamily)